MGADIVMEAMSRVTKMMSVVAIFSTTRSVALAMHERYSEKSCPEREIFDGLSQSLLPLAFSCGQCRIGSRNRGQLADFTALRRITSKDKVGRFGLLVAGEAAFHEGCVARFAVCEVTEPPASGSGVLF